MIVAYYIPHNEGLEKGIISAPGQTTGTRLVDLYEVDGTIRAFDTVQEAEDWFALQEKFPGADGQEAEQIMAALDALPADDPSFAESKDY